MANLGLRQAVDDPRTKGLVSTAEATTLQLEYRYLSHITGDPVYWDSVEKVRKTPLGIAEPEWAENNAGDESAESIETTLEFSSYIYEVHSRSFKAEGSD